MVRFSNLNEQKNIDIMTIDSQSVNSVVKC